MVDFMFLSIPSPPSKLKKLFGIIILVNGRRNQTFIRSYRIIYSYAAVGMSFLSPSDRVEFEDHSVILSWTQRLKKQKSMSI